MSALVVAASLIAAASGKLPWRDSFLPRLSTWMLCTCSSDIHPYLSLSLSLSLSHTVSQVAGRIQRKCPEQWSKLLHKHHLWHRGRQVRGTAARPARAHPPETRPKAGLNYNICTELQHVCRTTYIHITWLNAFNVLLSSHTLDATRAAGRLKTPRLGRSRQATLAGEGGGPRRL